MRASAEIVAFAVVEEGFGWGDVRSSEVVMGSSAASSSSSLEEAGGANRGFDARA